MKSSIVPAQVTSLEDTITANLTLTQIILLIIPVFICAIVFATIPPMMRVSIIKLLTAMMLSLPCLILSLRIRGTLVLSWFKLIVLFFSRPHLYLMTLKPTCSCKEQPVKATEPKAEIVAADLRVLSDLSPKELASLKHELKSRRIAYKSNKGTFNAIIESK